MFTNGERLSYLVSIQAYMLGDTSMTTAIQRVFTDEPSASKQVYLQSALGVLRRTSDPVKALESIDLLPGPALKILRAGQQTGEMAEGLKQARAYMETNQGNATKIIGPALAFSVDVLMGWGSLFAFKQQMIPDLAKLIAKARPGDITRLNDQFGQLQLFVNAIDGAHWVVVVGGALLTLAYWRGNKKVRESLDTYLLSIPLVGSYMKHNAMAASMRVAGHMLTGHAQTHEAMRAAADSVSIPAISGLWLSAYRGIIARGPSGMRDFLDSPLLTGPERQQLEAASRNRSRVLGEQLLELSKQRQGMLDGVTERIKGWVWKSMGIYIIVFSVMFGMWWGINSQASNSGMRAVLTGQR